MEYNRIEQNRTAQNVIEYNKTEQDIITIEYHSMEQNARDEDIIEQNGIGIEQPRTSHHMTYSYRNEWNIIGIERIIR